MAGLVKKIKIKNLSCGLQMFGDIFDLMFYFGGFAPNGAALCRLILQYDHICVYTEVSYAVLKLSSVKFSQIIKGMFYVALSFTA